MLVGGCRSTSRVARQSAGSQHTTVEAHPKTIVVETCEVLTANFQCTVDDISVNGQLRLRRDSVIWLSANKFVELGRALFTHDSVFVYAKVMNRYFKGTYADFQKKTGISTDFATLQALFIGESESVRRNWIQAYFSDWRETVEILDDGTTIKNKRYPYKAAVSLRSKPYSGRAALTFSKVRMNQPTSYPYHVGSMAKEY